MTDVRRTRYSTPLDLLLCLQDRTSSRLNRGPWLCMVQLGLTLSYTGGFPLPGIISPGSVGGRGLGQSGPSRGRCGSVGLGGREKDGRDATDRERWGTGGRSTLGRTGGPRERQEGSARTGRVNRTQGPGPETRVPEVQNRDGTRSPGVREVGYSVVWPPRCRS